MESNNLQSVYFSLATKLFLIALIIVFLIAGQDLFIPLTIALFFTFLLMPVSRRLEKLKIPKPVAILISIILAMAVFGVIIYFIYSQVMSFGDDLPELKKSLSEKMGQLNQFISEKFNISKREQTKWFNQKVTETTSSGDQYIMALFSTTGAFLANIALIPIYIFFLTYYKEKYRMFIMLVFKEDKHGNVMEIVRKISKVSQKYLKGIMLDILILSVLNSSGFLLLGLKHAILFGVIAAMLNIIPYIGVLIGSLLPVAMALITKDEVGYAFGAAGVCIFVQFVDNNFITPYVVGSSVSINPLAATIALVAGAMIWGIPGMILCMPLTGMMKVIFDNIESLKPYGFVIGEEVDYKNKDRLTDRMLRSISQRGKKKVA